MRLLSVLDARSMARARRLELRLTQEEVARRTGTSRQWVVGFENGDSGTELGMVLRLFAALELVLDVNPSPAADERLGGVDLDAHLYALGGDFEARGTLR
jgi:transcriptional regulator with XRE-family HTH domain